MPIDINPNGQIRATIEGDSQERTFLLRPMTLDWEATVLDLLGEQKVRAGTLYVLRRCWTGVDGQESFQRGNLGGAADEEIRKLTDSERLQVAKAVIDRSVTTEEVEK